MSHQSRAARAEAAAIAALALTAMPAAAAADRPGADTDAPQLEGLRLQGDQLTLVMMPAHVVDAAGGSSVLPLKFSLPRRSTTARAASGNYWPTVEAGWNAVKGQCVATDRSDWSGAPGIRSVSVITNYARFGYAYGTRLQWTAWLEIYDSYNSWPQWCYMPATAV
jgi:hypothetical protein